MTFGVLIKPQLILENVFFFTIVDDYTKRTRLFLMNHKSETQHLLESFITFAQNQFQASIKTIRVDNELEFVSMRNFFSSKKVLNVNALVSTLLNKME